MSAAVLALPVVRKAEAIAPEVVGRKISPFAEALQDVIYNISPVDTHNINPAETPFRLDRDRPQVQSLYRGTLHEWVEDPLD
jgi:hypothetical protein